MATTVPEVVQKRRSAFSRHLTAYLFISPWILGFLFFTLGPLLFSLTMSFHDWPVVGERTFIGFDNYRTMLFDDPQFWESLWITVKFAAIYVPFNIVMSFLIALMLHHATFASGFFRTAFYLPSVISGVALVTIWSWIYSREYGLLNFMLSLVGVDGPNWLGEPGLAIVAIIIASLWGFGGTMLILLTGLKAIPKELYEAATVSGVPGWAQMLFITLPMLGPMLLFTFITSIIAAFQQLTIALLMTKGGPLGSTYFFAMYIYDNAFKYFDMGYAAAGSWVMFLIVLVLSLLVMRWSSAWVYYEGEVKGGDRDA
ncbi:ABC transporter permease [Shinella sp. SUS2]|uniref:carbohydrate ABC transporter permease n=1 Tax=Shinella sp. DD12 TaxID=1410620 RepID=UPI00055BD995|nr:sugar ABC transporter permease [Shinella sp. DD12]KNY19001.1 ABC transporter permease [Shinella sp. SUS2]KOC76648.1 ABC transporter permease [Shinella sp. GWS1]MCA0344776.1 sugar ABC transporter permease [Pseudomonadota bacterium]